jgi:hypothetical protein
MSSGAGWQLELRRSNEDFWLRWPPSLRPETLLRWHRQPIAQKYDGSGKRGVRRPRTGAGPEQLVDHMWRQNTLKLRSCDDNYLRSPFAPEATVILPLWLPA